MSKSIKRRTNALNDSKAKINLKELFDAVLADLTAIRALLAGSVFGGFLTGSDTVDFGELADGAGESADITVTGAALGDFAIPSIGVDTVDMVVTASVTDDDTVTVRVQNESGSTADLAETTVSVLVIPSGGVLSPSALTLLE